MRPVAPSVASMTGTMSGSVGAVTKGKVAHAEHGHARDAGDSGV